MTPADVIAGRARWCVVEGDSADVLASLPPASVHALVTDPPAGIGFMGREWDKDRGGRAPPLRTCTCGARRGQGHAILCSRVWGDHPGIYYAPPPGTDDAARVTTTEAA